MLLSNIFSNRLNNLFVAATKKKCNEFSTSDNKKK